MPCIWLNHNKKQVFMDVAIASPAWVKARLYGRGHSLGIKTYKALIDTGAMGSCISERVVEDLNLSTVGSRPISGVSGSREHNFYYFYVGFIVPRPDIESEQDPDDADIQPNAIEGAEMIMPGASFDVLLGMDVLSIGSLAIEGNGTFSFSF